MIRRQQGAEQVKQGGKEWELVALYHTGPAGHCKDLYFGFEGYRAGRGREWGCFREEDIAAIQVTVPWVAATNWMMAVLEGRMSGFAADAVAAEDTG